MGSSQADHEAWPQVTLLNLYHLYANIYGVGLADGQLYTLDRETLVDMLKKERRSGNSLGGDPVERTGSAA